MATQNPLAALAAKANPAQQNVAASDATVPQTSQAPQNADTGDDESAQPDNAVFGSHNLARAYSNLNQKLIELADGAGIPRAVTIPHVENQSAAEHFSDVGKVLANSGGLTANLVAATHSVHDSSGGKTVAYNAKKAHETVIPKGSPEAKDAISACKTLVNKIGQLLPDSPEVGKAKSQLKLVGKNDGAGMTVSDLFVALIHISAGPIQSVARMHSFHKHGAIGHPLLTAPKVTQGK